MRFPRIQFGLRTLLVGSTLVAIGLGFLGIHWRRGFLLQQAVQTIQDAGGRVFRNKENRVDRVYLGGLKFGDEQLGKLAPYLRLIPELRELDLVGVSISDDGIESLAGLHQIEELYVFETKVTEGGIQRLGEILPAVEIKTESPDPVATKLAATNIYPHATVALDWAPDGVRLVTGSGDGRVRVWDGDSQEPVAQWTAHDNWAFAIEFSPDGRLLATGGGDNVVRLWDATTQNLLGELRGHEDDVHAVGFTPDGATLVSAGDDATIRLWDVRRRTALRVLEGHHAQIPAIAVSPDGEVLASASRDHTVRLWDRASGDVLAVLDAHEDDVMAVAFSPKGGQLASAGYDGSVRLWDLQTYELVETLSGHDGRVYSIAFDPSGETLASAGEDGVRIWQLSTGVSRASRDQRNVSRVAFHPRRAVLATTNASGELRLLDARAGVTLRIFRTLYGERGLTLPLALASANAE